MNKSEKVNQVREWLNEFPEMEVPLMVEKISEELGVTEATAQKYMNEASKPPKEKAVYLSVAKGHKSSFDKSTIKKHVDFDSEDYAFLELEKREFSTTSPTKISKPRIVSFNKRDLISFLKITKEGTGKDTVEVCEGREIHGSVNVVYHIPEAWNIKATADDWAK